jgi:hypothetical protein
MAQRHQLRRSVTSSYVPSAGDINQGELFANINPADKKVYIKLSDNSIFEVAGSSYALLASPALTGTPTAPTAAAGTNTTQLATTAFVQSATQTSQAGLDSKQSVKAATTAALPANTAAGSKVGKTLTANANGALSIDGVTVWNDIDNDGGSADPYAESSTRASRVLIKDEGSADNGIYVVKDKGSGSTPFILIRATDADEDVEVSAGMFTFVHEGTANADTGWVLATNDDVTVDTTTQTFAQFTGAGSLTEGDGINISGSTISVDVTDIAGTGLENDGSNNLRLAAQGNGIAGGAGSTLSVQEDTTGGANLATVVNVSANGVAIRIDNSSIIENGSGQLEVQTLDGGVI